MYLEKQSSSKAMDKDINEATAKLKGLLGIGGGLSVAPSKETVPTTGTSTPAPAGHTTSKSSNKKSKKKGGKDSPPSQKNNGNKQQQQKPKGKKKNNNNNPATPAKSENFAWSAFQSSPDPSKLPLPAFSPSNAKTTVDIEPISCLLNQAAGAGAGGPSDPPDLSNAARAEDIEDQLIAEAKQKEAAGKPKEEPTTVKDESPSEAPVSKTGVNLAAALASNTSQHNTSDPQQSSPPLSSQQYSNPTQSYNHQPVQQQQQQQQQYPPPPPPGYVTIQVQVPMVLMPGRQMYVTTPNGFPVQVQVPEGIPPGAVISVHVPAGPPLHMMPAAPSHHNPYHHQQQQHQQQQYYQQQQQQHAPPR
jgi:hypothetical protein